MPTWPGLPGAPGTCPPYSRKVPPRSSNWQEAGTGPRFAGSQLWPLIGAALKEGSLEQALTYAAMLLDDSQQPQPQTIRERLASAFAAWQAGHGVQARAHLDAAASVAAARGYL